MQKHTVHFLTREPPQRAEFWPPRINITWRWIVNHRHSCPLRTWLSFWTCFLVSAASHKLTFARVFNADDHWHSQFQIQWDFQGNNSTPTPPCPKDLRKSRWLSGRTFFKFSWLSFFSQGHLICIICRKSRSISPWTKPWPGWPGPEGHWLI